MKKYLHLGILWTVLGVAAQVFDFVHTPAFFTLYIGPVPIPIGLLLIIYGILHLIYYYLLYKETLFTRQEEQEYGEALEKAMPTIIDGIKAGRHVDDISREVEEQYGIPPLITLKFILNLGRLMKKK